MGIWPHQIYIWVHTKIIVLYLLKWRVWKLGKLFVILVDWSSFFKLQTLEFEHTSNSSIIRFLNLGLSLIASFSSFGLSVTSSLRVLQVLLRSSFPKTHIIELEFDQDWNLSAKTYPIFEFRIARSSTTCYPFQICHFHLKPPVFV